jgi:hypothetical protein
VKPKIRMLSAICRICLRQGRASHCSHRFDEVVRSVSVAFQQGPAGIERGLEALSDGQQSLFYFALAAAVQAPALMRLALYIGPAGLAGHRAS